jgi:xanthine dehydrogenase accessory factor
MRSIPHFPALSSCGNFNLSIDSDLLRHFRSKSLCYYRVMRKTVLVRGCGDVGSAVAYVLFKAGHSVVIHDSAQPATTRRTMSFSDAIFDGAAGLEGVRGQRMDDLLQIRLSLEAGDGIPLTTLELPQVLAALQPDVLVDARMRKHDRPEIQINLAPFTIGLGPNFIAGETVHAAVETGWNEDLGKVIWKGSPRPLEGEPQTIAGHARDRYVYAPVTGIFRTGLQIGAVVAAGEEVARIGELQLCAPISGMIRGLTHDAVPVKERTKVIEVDPRGAGAQITGIAQRPGKIAAGVLEALEKLFTEGEAKR